MSSETQSQQASPTQPPLPERFRRGTKVEAFIKYNDKEIFTLGPGSYDGWDSPRFLGGIPTEKITLDNGDVVYDCECLCFSIGSRDYKKFVADKKIHKVKLHRDARGVYSGYEELPEEVKAETPAEEASAPETESAPKEDVKESPKPEESPIEEAVSMLRKLFGK